MIQCDAATRLFLLLGRPVDHSLSPLLHNAAFQALRLNCVYLTAAVEADVLPEALLGLKALHIGGANITSPYKEAVLPFLEQISPAAQSICSVNTIVNREGQLCGDSTDGPGFTRALKEAGLAHLLDEPILIIGAGGAARAVALSLAGQGAAQLAVANRTAQRAEKLVTLLKGEAALKTGETVSLQAEALRRCWEGCRTLVYCLPEERPEVAEILSASSCRGRYFFDLRYHPPVTKLMRLFRERGGSAYNGKRMLLWQAALAFEQFTGRSAPLEAMRRAIGAD